ncbi:Uncharacterized membrane protein YcaP, DUF421 family [Alkalithermobacter thermoalcaliphilus JW-YL-7 = DSM 7308]|uniref:Uncharacterized membrane protein YcaP, DUF421 family n=1 Tax=Alkalithermobacter thermoalcaliphilus JW-YL-7 = DSM 7308 TaxID=1121328 RepID=A0A150FNZ0_CLOPD|nr:protein of unknown function DUF421 [[Clostridium] paradoxum JW-YL-7 = DSM 7308]SHK55316.1 Uncharacterized membrane protein YcaP, DUF421 family [[Clostridium] paradoxum JW-YL-7 = DSM 7308]
MYDMKDFYSDIMYAVRILGGYAVALTVARLMGKRSVGELGVFDLVLMTGVGHIMSTVALDKEVPFHDAVLILMILVLLENIVSYIALKSRKLGELIEGKPMHLIRDGKLLFDNMKKEKFNERDLLQELRKKGIRKEEEVDQAIIEACGKFSVLLKEEEEPLKRKDLGIIKEGQSPKYLDDKFNEIKQELINLRREVEKIKRKI